MEQWTESGHTNLNKTCKKKFYLLRLSATVFGWLNRRLFSQPNSISAKNSTLVKPVWKLSGYLWHYWAIHSG